MQRPWNYLKETLVNWRVWGLPGAIAIGMVVAARFTGSLQGLELSALDTFLRLRPSEPEDDRIVLVGFDDIQTTGYPIPEKNIVDVINTLQTYQPSVIGLHIQKNQVAETGNNLLFAGLKQYKNLIVTEVVLTAADQISAPAGFAKDSIGFVDIAQDADDHTRRLPLGLYNPIDLTTYKRSLAIRLSEKYLISRDPSLNLQNGIADPYAMRFGSTELPRLLSNSGGYVNIDVGFPELLLNFRVGKVPFRLLSASDIKSKKFDPEWLRDRIVIVGITDPIIRAPLSTAATTSTNSLQVQAHAVSQIISAVLDGRPLINTWSDTWEYVWILGWGILAIIWGRSNLSYGIKLMGVGSAQIGLILASYLLLLGGWWIAVVPASLIWLINSLGYTAFYKYDWVLRSRLKENQRLIEDRQRLIEQIFNVIHNGPLQTLASVLRRLQDNSLSQAQLLLALENLNIEVRQIGAHAQQEILTEERGLYLRDGVKLDLQIPIHELFYEVYSYTLERPEFSRFETLKVACDFAPLEQPTLSIEQRQNLCRFLEEALCNVGKHAEGATHLSVLGAYEKGWYTLQVTDDGIGVKSAVEGEGSRYARKVAAQMRGKFKRESISPQGTLCELSIPTRKSRWW